MFTLILALIGSAYGFWSWYPRAGRPGRRLLSTLAIHLGFVAVGIVSFQLLAASLGRFALCCAAGLYFAVLFAVHAGHAFAVRNWGAPLHRAVVVYSVRNLRQLTKAAPRSTAYLIAALTVVFAIGVMTSTADILLGTFAGQIFLGTPVAIALMLAGATVLWLQRSKLCRDPLLRLFSGPHLIDFGLLPGDFRQREIEVQLGVAGPCVKAGAMPTFDPDLGSPLLRIKPGNPPRRRATVVLFIVDSLRARNLSFQGYHRQTAPFLERCIAQRGARTVPLAVSNCVSSECASWSILSSRRYRHLATNSVNLHHVLRTAGYKTHFFLSGMHRGWMGLEHLYGSGHDSFLDCVADTRIVAETAKLPSQKPDDSDFFCFHLMSVHCAGALEPQYRRWLPAHSRVPYLGQNCPDQRTYEGIVNHFDNTILQADDYIRQILTQLEQKGYLRDAIVIVTADHGESLGERSGSLGIIGHANSLFQESIQIPLFIMDTKERLPEPSPLADQTDIAPTVADLLGIAPPDSWQGQSIFQTPYRQSTHTEFITHNGKLPGSNRRAMEAILSITDADIYKLLRHKESGQETLRAAFDLTVDPNERYPIADEAIIADLEGLRGAFANIASSESLQRGSRSSTDRTRAA